MVVAVRAAPEAPEGDADPDLARSGRCLESSQLERRRTGARGVILVRERRPEDAVQVCALVAERQLKDVAAVAVQDTLSRANEFVELLARRLVGVVVDAAEVDEDWIRGP